MNKQKTIKALKVLQRYNDFQSQMAVLEHTKAINAYTHAKEKSICSDEYYANSLDKYKKKFEMGVYLDLDLQKLSIDVVNHFDHLSIKAKQSLEQTTEILTEKTIEKSKLDIKAKVIDRAIDRHHKVLIQHLYALEALDIIDAQNRSFT